MDAALFALALLPLGLLVLVVAAATFGELAMRQSVRLAAASPCPTCGAVFGLDAVRKGRRGQADRVAELRRQNPDVMLRLAAGWNVTCTKCGSVARFDPTTNSFTDALGPGGAMEPPR